jgi:hypothetical protein
LFLIPVALPRPSAFSRPVDVGLPVSLLVEFELVEDEFVEGEVVDGEVVEGEVAEDEPDPDPAPAPEPDPVPPAKPRAAVPSTKVPASVPASVIVRRCFIVIYKTSFGAWPAKARIWAPSDIVHTRRNIFNAWLRHWFSGVLAVELACGSAADADGSVRRAYYVGWWKKQPRNRQTSGGNSRVGVGVSQVAS